MRYQATIAIAVIVAGAGLAVYSVSSLPPRKAVDADRHPIGDTIGSVRGSVCASVRWLTADATQTALAALR
ncbi:hypothetical protein SAMN05443247_02013 [Bradyrhizobium erythrophlei]|jgi:hypothetical protein|nr:hypothetical protein SAMN05443247_02013 [Bradyrhizobium erythrophlei]